MEEFQKWTIKNNIEVKKAIDLLVGSKRLEIEIIFYFNRISLYCKDGRIKKMDLTNRLKAFMDLLSKALKIDDSQFFKLICKKSDTYALPYVDVKIFPLLD